MNKDGQTRPRLELDEFKVLQEYRAIKDEAKKMGIDPRSVNHGWLKSKEASLHFTNPDYDVPEFDPEKIDWGKIIGDKAEPKTIKPKTVNEGHFDRLVITDRHIGMTPNKDGTSLYGGEWNEAEIRNRMLLMVAHCAINRKSDTLYLDDLGDLMDGWDGLTVRRQHPLPQNMDNQGAFDVAMKTRIDETEYLLEYYDKIIIHNVCKDNHSGAFGYVVNSAFKNYIEKAYPERVFVENIRKFISHYEVGKNTFILTHGKDDINLKFGFPVHLNDKARKKIDEYIDHNFLLKKGVHIEFSKGDSHQSLFDKCTSERFYYMNYPSFCPSSNWIQVNFQRGRSGIVLFNYHDKNRPNFFSTHELFFDWKE
jgi:hypothetical protein